MIQFKQITRIVPFLVWKFIFIKDKRFCQYRYLNRVVLIFSLLHLMINKVSAQLDQNLTYRIFKNSGSRQIFLSGGLREENSVDDLGLRGALPGHSVHLWRVEPVKGGYYKIKNRETGRYLAVSGNSLIRGDRVLLWEDVGQSDIIWQVIRSGDSRFGFTYKIKNKHSGLFLGIEGGSNVIGAKAVQWTDEGQDDIVWRLEGEEELRVIPEERPGGESIHIMPKTEWQRLFTRALSGFQIKINNYTPTANQFTGGVTYRYNKPNDCYIQFGEKIKHAFGMSYFRMDPATIYFINLTNHPPSINNFGTELLIEMSYDIRDTRNDYEIFANCIENLACGDGMWWINLTMMHMRLYFTPVLENGKISYTNPRVLITGAIRSEGSNVVVQNFNSGALFRRLADQIQLQLDTPEAKQFFRENFHNNLLSEARTAYREMAIGSTPSTYTRVSIQPNGDLKFER